MFDEINFINFNKFIVYMYFYKVFNISLGVVCPLWSSCKTLPANAGGRRFKSHRGQQQFIFHILL